MTCRRCGNEDVRRGVYCSRCRSEGTIHYSLDHEARVRGEFKPVPAYIADDDDNEELLVWAKSFEEEDRSLEKTDLSHGVMVSTVFLGLDHNFGNGAPLLFETMIFGGPADGYQDRYSTEGEARIGHERMILQAKNSLTRWWRIVQWIKRHKIQLAVGFLVVAITACWCLMG